MEERRYTYFWGLNSILSGLIEKNMSRNRKIKVRHFSGVKIKYMCHYAIPLLEKNPGNIILHLVTNDTPYKSGSNILKDLIEFKDFILEKLPSCKKIILLPLTIISDKENAKKNNDFFYFYFFLIGIHSMQG